MKGRVTRLAIVAAAVTAWAVGHVATASACGVERWNVKTLQDPAADEVNFTATTTTVDSLRNLAVPVHIGDHTPRLTGIERQTVKVKAQLVAMKIEEDGDVHLVIAAPRHRSHTMIVEFPSSSCTGKAAPAARQKMAAARSALTTACGSVPTSSFATLHGKATVTGVGFFDEIHGQRGVAPNGIELHPVLAFTSTTCRRSSGGGGGGGGSSCERGYSPCLPIVADLDCSDIPDSKKPIRVTGPDRYRLDGDGDGWGCQP